MSTDLPSSSSPNPEGEPAPNPSSEVQESDSTSAEPTQSGPPENGSSGGSSGNTIVIVVGGIIIVVLVLLLLRNLLADDDDSGSGAPAPGPSITITSPVGGTVLEVGVPFDVRGQGAALPEGNVVVQAIDANDTVLAEAATTVQAPDAGTGGAGPWAVQLTVAAPLGTGGTIRAFSTSPASGGVVADASVNVTYGSEGVAQPALTISIPQQGEEVSSAEVVVVGSGTALSENNVVVRVLDESGATLAEQPTTVASDVGGTGEWRVTLQPNATPGTAGKIYAFSPSPADGGIVAEALVDVTFGGGDAAALTIDAPQQNEEVSPVEVVVVGTGTALPENNVVVRVLDAGGAVLAEKPTTVDTSLRGSGEWRATLQPNATPGTTGSVYAFSPSPADGSIVADATVNVLFGQTAETKPPAIVISTPPADTVVDPANIVVSGVGTALPENNVVVRALGPDGAVLNEQAATVNADLGGTGDWQATLVVEIAAGTAGSIYAFSSSPADGSIVADATILVQYGAP